MPDFYALTLSLLLPALAVPPDVAGAWAWDTSRGYCWDAYLLVAPRGGTYTLDLVVNAEGMRRFLTGTLTRESLTRWREHLPGQEGVTMWDWDWRVRGMDRTEVFSRVPAARTEPLARARGVGGVR